MPQYLFTGNSHSSAQPKETTMAYAALNCNTSSEKQQHTNSKFILKKKHLTERPKDIPDFHFGFLHITNFIAVKFLIKDMQVEQICCQVLGAR